MMKSFKLFVLSASMFSGGALAATLLLSNLHLVSANPLRVAQQSDDAIVEENGVRLELKGCKRVSRKQTVTCNLTVTNISNEDITFSLYSKLSRGLQSRTFDTSGQEYIATASSIGKDPGSWEGYARTGLIRGVPTKGSLSFELPQQVDKLAVIEVSYQIHNQIGLPKAQFRNVNIGALQASNSANSNCICPPQRKPSKAR